MSSACGRGQYEHHKQFLEMKHFGAETIHWRQRRHATKRNELEDDAVHSAIGKLKAGEDDGDVGLGSDYFIHACNELLVHISLLFTCLLVHGTAPQALNMSTVIPIPKGKNVCLSDSSNYRGIALSSIYGKIFDLVILSRCQDQLCLLELQFGFRSKRSTDQCTMVLKRLLTIMCMTVL